jgi:excinuclease UvrABC ATPase subunit
MQTDDLTFLGVFTAITSVFTGVDPPFYEGYNNITFVSNAIGGCKWQMK